MLPSTFLIIDPNLHFSRAAANYLSKFQEVEKVELAADTDEAFLITDASTPEALLVDYDYYINEIRTRAFCEKMKEHFPDILIIALTLYTFEFDDNLLLPVDFISGIISKQDFAERLFTMFNVPLTS